MSSESGSRRWSATLTCSGAYPSPGSGAASRRAGARENPPFGPDVHCMGVRTARRPGTSRFSPMPISSP
ncbi:Uncharacterised protein [Mycobacteroides abscessus]|nr:Uncharacterised protein [Mycobacteroides abscessus]